MHHNITCWCVAVASCVSFGGALNARCVVFSVWGGAWTTLLICEMRSKAFWRAFDRIDRVWLCRYRNSRETGSLLARALIANIRSEQNPLMASDAKRCAKITVDLSESASIAKDLPASTTPRAAVPLPPNAISNPMWACQQPYIIQVCVVLIAMPLFYLSVSLLTDWRVHASSCF